MPPSTLTALLADYHIPLEEAIPITGLAVDSRALKAGEVFLAYPGTDTDGRRYILAAIQRGASAILYEPPWPPELPQQSIPCIPFPNLRDHIGAIAAHWFNYPTRNLPVYGVTGTNGKTSCSHYIAQCLTALAQPCGVIGTIGVGFPGQLKPSALTTADALTNQQLIASLLSEGAQALAMEVSSHALVQGRVNSVFFDTAVLTNLTHDHLDYHLTMAAYAAAKTQLFHWPSLKNAIVNLDDPFGLVLFKELSQQGGLNLIGYTIQDEYPELDANKIVRATQITHDISGLRAYITTPWGEGWLQCRLLGHFNLENILAVLAALGANGIPLASLLTVIQQVIAVPGRMQCFGGDKQPLVVVDYAHTPDALKQVLKNLRAYHPQRLWCVFGCGGDRDPAKRPIMGQVVEEWSDKLIVTNDNPRMENPEKIGADIKIGISANADVQVEYDRAKAIKMAILSAQPGDVVLIAGKGHEDYQIIGKEKTHFSDAEVVAKVLEERK